jgi:hypothetical protein
MKWAKRFLSGKALFGSLLIEAILTNVRERLGDILDMEVLRIELRVVLSAIAALSLYPLASFAVVKTAQPGVCSELFAQGVVGLLGLRFAEILGLAGRPQFFRTRLSRREAIGSGLASCPALLTFAVSRVW